MLRAPWDLEALMRYKHREVLRERHHVSRCDRTSIRERLTNWRRRIGNGLIQIGATIAGDEAVIRPNA